MRQGASTANIPLSVQSSQLSRNPERSRQAKSKDARSSQKDKGREKKAASRSVIKETRSQKSLIRHGQI